MKVKYLLSIVVLLLLTSSCLKNEEDSSLCDSPSSYRDADGLTIVQQNATTATYSVRVIGYPTGDYTVSEYVVSYSTDGSIPAEGCVHVNKIVGDLESEYSGGSIYNIPEGSTLNIRVCLLKRVDEFFACPSRGLVESIAF